MFFLRRLLIQVYFISAGLLAIFGSTTKAFATDFLQQAETTAETVQETWYQNNSGEWVGTYKGPNGYWWNSANVLIGLLQLMVNSNYKVSYQAAMENTFKRGPNLAPGFINNYNDDTQWWAITWLKAYEVMKNIDPNYPQANTMLNISKNIFNRLITTQWDNTFGGGLWWSTTHGSTGYKNAITNGLFIILSTQLAQNIPEDPTYLSWAKKAWEWYKNSGLINADNLINDGLNSQGQNNGGITWTYNQGAVIGGLVGLYKLTADAEYLDEAQKLANATMLYLSDKNMNVLQDLCEPLNNCEPNPNSGQFKGIFMRYFVELAEVTEDPVLRSHYIQFISDSAQSDWNNNRNAMNQFGHKWTGSFNFADPMFQSSTLDLFNAMVRVEQLVISE